MRLQAAHMVAEERSIALLLTHALATRCAAQLLADWQGTLRARQHWRRQTQRACLGFWSYWAPAHARRNAGAVGGVFACCVPRVHSRGQQCHMHGIITHTDIGWRAAAQQLAAKRRARCFYCWRWYCQVRLLREVAFQNKQRAIREALVVGEHIARQRRAALLTASFMAWHVQVSKYRKVAQKLASLLQRSLSSCFRSWREASDAARVSALRAQRHADAALLGRTLPAWADAAAQLAEQRAAGEAAADKLRRRALLAGMCGAWAEQMQVAREQRQGLWRLMLMLLHRERLQLLEAGLGAWQGWVQERVAFRATIGAFVNTRRLACLSGHLTLWHQYAAAMRPDSGGSADGGSAVASGSGLLQHVLSQLPRSVSPGARLSVHPHQQHQQRAASAFPAFGGGSNARVAPAAAAAWSRPGSPVLPVSGGPSSPLLGPRSAQQDRRLARRLAAMGGAAAEVRGVGPCRACGCRKC
jgi:hypothetical protein